MTVSRNYPPGREWLAIISRPALVDFACAFTAEPVLEASILSSPIIGISGIRTFFQATRGMYDRFAFIAEHGSNSWTCLEWKGVYRGQPIAGATILIADQNGIIERIRLVHTPFDQLLAFAADLHRRLEAVNPDS